MLLIVLCRKRSTAGDVDLNRLTRFCAFYALASSGISVLLSTRILGQNTPNDMKKLIDNSTPSCVRSAIVEPNEKKKVQLYTTSSINYPDY